MHVNTGGLRAGGNNSYTAAEHAHDGASVLSRIGIDSTIFGDFDEAHAMHAAVSSAHGRHVALIKGHTESLSTIGEKAHSAAGRFDDMEEHNRTELHNVGH